MRNLAMDCNKGRAPRRPLLQILRNFQRGELEVNNQKPPCPGTNALEAAQPIEIGSPSFSCHFSISVSASMNRVNYWESSLFRNQPSSAMGYALECQCLQLVMLPALPLNWPWVPSALSTARPNIPLGYRCRYMTGPSLTLGQLNSNANSGRPLQRG
jgi:hypothetical protein